jgi:maltooligosyltrehalose trehalohydrolase
MDFAIPPLGAHYLGSGRCEFCVWAPKVRELQVTLFPSHRVEPLSLQHDGYYTGTLAGVEPGTRYFFRLDEQTQRPDPASRSQPEGVHAASEVIDPHFTWSDDGWHGVPVSQLIIYELHVGTFSAEGTFAGAAQHLDRLQHLGITAIELMPVAQFPGPRNWGYDGVYPFAVQQSYGGPLELKRFVDQCHARGIAVLLDVVYNHLGPEGNYLDLFGHYFTSRYRTPWGDAINFDGPESDHVRRYFVENALHWVCDFHIDGLRLDAVHAIFDQSARPFLKELASAVHAEGLRLDRQIYVFEESSKNDPTHLQPHEINGWNLDGVWCDDFHHSLHALLTGERSGYYADFGTFEHFEKAYREGFVYTGQYSTYRRKRHGVTSATVPSDRFVVYSQNHDQVGNRLEGDRLIHLLPQEAVKLVAGLVLLSPCIPMLFMGEEYGETAPFLYFVSHEDIGLLEAVRRGRREEFAAFGWPRDIPDPEALDTYEQSRLNDFLRDEPSNRVMLAFYRELIRLRKELPSLAQPSKSGMSVTGDAASGTLRVERTSAADRTCMLFCLSAENSTVRSQWPTGSWQKSFDSADARWLGTGSALASHVNSKPGNPTELLLNPYSFAVYHSRS